MTEPHDAPSGPPHDTATETHSEPHGADGDDSTHATDDHAQRHDSEPLGPLDAPRWIAGVGGVLIGLVVAACFAFSTGAL